MMPATEKMHNGSGSGDPEKTGRPTKSGDGRRVLESEHWFMQNVSTRKLTKAIERERNPTAKFRLLACRLRKKGYNIRKICRELDTAYSSARLAGSDEQARIEGPVQQETHGQAGQAQLTQMCSESAPNANGSIGMRPSNPNEPPKGSPETRSEKQSSDI